MRCLPALMEIIPSLRHYVQSSNGDSSVWRIVPLNGLAVRHILAFGQPLSFALQERCRKMKEAALGIVNDPRWYSPKVDCTALSSEILAPILTGPASSVRLTL